MKISPRQLKELSVILDEEFKLTVNKYDLEFFANNLVGYFYLLSTINDKEKVR